MAELEGGLYYPFAISLLFLATLRFRSLSWPFTFPGTSNFHRSTFIPHVPCTAEPRFLADAFLDCLTWVTYRFVRVNLPRALPCGYARGAGYWTQVF